VDVDVDVDVVVVVVVVVDVVEVEDQDQVHVAVGSWGGYRSPQRSFARRIPKKSRFGFRTRSTRL
jgi:hypothetical protein